ncbi:MAG: endonuclease/exonuclease/phosphatase family protein [SAR324 cluster bacterium]|nr:endonuclease/exonuclease/phosphatase family protein [SAR324 cluster bacterium]
MLTIVSWNIQYGKGVDGVIDLTRIAQQIRIDGLPDILCLQEISRNYPATDGGCDQFAELQNLFPEYESFFGAAHDRVGGHNGVRKQFGNLILTRRTPTQVLHHLLPSPADPAAKFLSRQTSELIIPSTSGAFRLMNTHLEFFSEKQQLAQVQRLRELHVEASSQFHEPGIDLPDTPFELLVRPEKMIICGDFNFTPDSKSYQQMTAPFANNVSDLVDAWDVLHPAISRTPTCGIFDHKQWKNGPHCRDYFFLSKNLIPQIKEISVNTKTAASDHQPVRLIIKA